MNSRRHDAAKENDVNDDSITLPDLNWLAAEKTLCETALRRCSTMLEAAALLGMTRHALKRRIIKHNLRPEELLQSRETPPAEPTS